MDLQQLQQMLQVHGISKDLPETTLTFNLWSRACRSADVQTMLRQPGVLVQALQQLYAPCTAISYLKYVCCAAAAWCCNTAASS
jgi:hypothetical protein